MEKTTATKKTKAPTVQKKKPQSSSTSHPPYFQMIKEAILALHEKTGSSPHAIAKFIEEKHKGKLPQNFRKLLSVQLRNSSAKGKLIKIKASFKLSASAKQEVKVVSKNVKAKALDVKKKAKEAVKPNKKRIVSRSAPAKRKAVAAPKKTVAGAKGIKKAVVVKAKKRAASAKPKPKSIKAPAAKKDKKVAA